MASSSAMRESRYSVRSISMPSRSHPNALTVEESLSKLKAWESSSMLKTEKILFGLAGLVELYNCVEDLLQLSTTRRTLINHYHCPKWVDQVLDGSVRLLDVCGTTRDVLVQMKEHVQDLQSVLRRRGGDAGKDKEVDAYVCFRKKMKTDLTKCLRELKLMDDNDVSLPLSDQHDHSLLEKMSSVLREARAITISVFQSLVSLMSVPMKTRTSRWFLVSKLIHNRQLAGEGEQEDLGLACVDNALYTLGQNDSKEDEVENVLKAQKGLEALRVTIEDIQVGLDCLFRHLIQNRVSLLNVFTQ